MDSRVGACWRCGRPGGTKCTGCELALYCSSACQERDKVRHQVECINCATKHKCSVCSMVAENVKMCAACEKMWYCSASCQRLHWRNHKETCKETRENIVFMAIMALQQILSGRKKMGALPYYWGTSPAQDLIKINQNEGEYPEKMAILLAGDGNLRNVMATVAGLKQSFQGSIHFVLNDIDRQVMARNVLFLYILWKYKGEEKAAQQLTQIWYSVKIGEEETTMVEECLVELLSLPDDTNMLCGGRVTMSAEQFSQLRPIFELWLSLLTGEKAIQKSPQEQLRLIYELAPASERLYLQSIPRRHLASAKDWFKNGILLPMSDPRRKCAYRDNVTLAAWNPAHDEERNPRFPAFTEHVGKFATGINDDAMPFSDWDYLEVKVLSSDDDLLKMYSNYIDDIVKKFAYILNQGRISFHVILDNCLNVQAHLPVEIRFDRIFTSNISDYINYPVVLETFRPLLRKENNKSVIITEFLNWTMCSPAATPCRIDGRLNMWLLDQAVEDVRHEPDRPIWASEQVNNGNETLKLMVVCQVAGQLSVAEYFDNFGVFNQYLRAALLAHKCPESFHRDVSPKDVPKMSDVRNVSGMKMRNVLRELNTVCPFRYRVNMRRVTKINAHRRALEWTLPESAD